MTKLSILLLATGLVSLTAADAQTPKAAYAAKTAAPAKATTTPKADTAAKATTSTKTAATAKPNFTLNVDLTTIATPLDKIYFSYYNTVTKVRFNDSADLGTLKKVTLKNAVAERVLAQLRVVPTLPATDTAQNKRPVSQAKWANELTVNV